MIEQMKLAGLADRTQEVYLQGVQSLVKHCANQRPERLTEEEVRRYILEVQADSARGTFKTCYYGIRFLYCQTLGVDWGLFKKRSAFRSRGDFHKSFPMPRFGAFLTASATRSTAVASA